MVKNNKDKVMQEIIEALKEIRAHQPNGELKRIIQCVSALDVKVTEMHDKIMDPQSGLIVQTNKNTDFREMCEPERELLIHQFKGVLRWKKVIEWGIGVIFVAVIGGVIKVMLG